MCRHEWSSYICWTVFDQSRNNCKISVSKVSFILVVLTQAYQVYLHFVTIKVVKMQQTIFNKIFWQILHPKKTQMKSLLLQNREHTCYRNKRKAAILVDNFELKCNSTPDNANAHLFQTFKKVPTKVKDFLQRSNLNINHRPQNNVSTNEIHHQVRQLWPFKY